ncbi:MAG: Na+:solute symporter [Saprospiraceae bacterium]|nr:Na+:solute symporter [Saprospiraceae bacterium]
MNLSSFDWTIIIAFFGLTLILGLIASRKASSSVKEYFLSGRNMPWWLLGVSMVATTFSADTPNLVTDIIRKGGVAGNWVWWAFLITGMFTVFIYAKLWRRSGITTDLEFYEMRYSGKEATFLRGFRSLYLGVFFNVLIMATVLLAGIKIAGVMLGINPLQTVMLVSLITVVYASLGGLRGILLTDFFQFILSMAGMIAAAIYIVQLPEIGGLENLINHPNLEGKTAFFPDFSDLNVAIPLFFVPIAVQWWSAWYPGAEPGGGGYIAQRMLSAKNEKDATKATLFFNFAHYALRPWPWILIALASLVLFPDMDSIKQAFPAIQDGILGDDIAFPAMLTYLPKGLLGLVVAALIAALMSTISTHLNWGASYFVHDFYVRFLNPDASEKKLVSIARWATICLMVLAAVVSLYLTNALQAFNILLQIGAGTGLLFLLRWFWWRINAYSELSAMIISFVVAVYFEFIYSGSMEPYERLITGVVITSIGWIAVTFLTRPTAKSTLKSFYTLIQPHKAGWKPVVDEIDEALLYQPQTKISQELIAIFLGCIGIYSLLFGVGYLLYGDMIPSMVCLIVGGASLVTIIRLINSTLSDQ